MCSVMAFQLRELSHLHIMLYFFLLQEHYGSLGLADASFYKENGET